MMPRVLVLLAAHNGRRFLESQISSILAQRAVAVRVVISVDRSQDRTEELVDLLASADSRIAVLPHGRAFGAAAPNFYRLICTVSADGFTHVAFSDQDDVWLPDKLLRATSIMHGKGVQAFSSNVCAWFNGERLLLLNKVGRQKEWDHLFSSAGPGCTYVLEAQAFREFAAWLSRIIGQVEQTVEYHDWLVYAWARSNGFAWWIDRVPLVLYRQHESNQLGANVGVSAALRRLSSARGGWYDRQALSIASALGVLDLPPIALLRQRGVASRLRLVKLSPQLRRTKRGVLAVALVHAIVRRPC
jgi:rhamnosyltransferase